MFHEFPLTPPYKERYDRDNNAPPEPFFNYSCEFLQETDHEFYAGLINKGAIQEILEFYLPATALCRKDTMKTSFFGR